MTMFARRRGAFVVFSICCELLLCGEVGVTPVAVHAVIVYLCYETLGKGDRALVRSVACCDSYWCVIMYPWEPE